MEVEQQISHADYTIGLDQLEIQESALRMAVKDLSLREDIVDPEAHRQAITVLATKLHSLVLAVKLWKKKMKILPKTRLGTIKIWLWKWSVKERFSELRLEKGGV